MSANAQRSRGVVATVKQATWWDRLWQPFWMLPAALTLAGVIAGAILPELDRELRGIVWWVFPGGADAARGALTTVASVTISTVGVVFSITMVVLQLAASQFTPRVLGAFLRSRVVQTTFGMFIATFVFSLMALRSVLNETDDSPGFVPRVSVSFAFLLVLACVSLFLAFIRHITLSIQVSTVISSIGDQTMRLLDRIMPGMDAPEYSPSWSPALDTPRHHIHVGNRHGHVDEVDLPRLVRLAAEHKGVLVLGQKLGDFTTRGQLLATFWGQEWPEDASATVNDAIHLATERSLQQDLGFGFRQLLDIADRALSTGINDPTTAVQVIDELHRLLREAVQRVAPSPYVTDGEGLVRVVAEGPNAQELLRQTVTEIAFYGKNNPAIQPRLASMLDDIATCALPRYQSTIDELRELVSE